MAIGEMYTDGEYKKNNPKWHIEDSPWKADHIYRLIQKHHVEPRTICEVGCGSGEILRQLNMLMPSTVTFTGYEISLLAFDFCQQRKNDRLCFKLKNFTDDDVSCDLILLIDLIEHLEDYFSFLRTIKSRSNYKILHIPLEMFVFAVVHQQFLLGQKKKVGHLHFFSKDLALQLLRDLGYEIIDHSYTAGYLLPRDNSMKDRVLKIPRQLLFPLFPDFTARVFGGYSLLVLVK